jgi:hypothetical protein
MNSVEAFRKLKEVLGYEDQKGCKKQAKKSKEAPQIEHGEMGDFRKLTITLPPDIFEQLVLESSRRKIAKKPNSLMASIVREAVVAHFSKESWTKRLVETT